MKLPICNFCAKTGMLCSNCKEKLNLNEINNNDVEISKILIKNQSNRSFQNLKFFNSIDTSDLTIIAGNSVLKKSIQNNRGLSNDLNKLLKKPFEVVSKESTVRKTLSTLFSPVEVSSIDEIFVPDGTKEIRLNLRGISDDLPLKGDVDLLKLIASKLTDSDIRFEFIN